MFQIENRLSRLQKLHNNIVEKKLRFSKGLTHDFEENFEISFQFAFL